MTTLVECVECGDTHSTSARKWKRGAGQSACPVCGALDFRPARGAANGSEKRDG